MSYTTDFEFQRTELLENLEDAHIAYYQANVFGGPSLHFHLRALTTAKAGDLASFSEREYTLRFLFGNGQIRNDKSAEWSTLRRILQQFFYPVSGLPEIVAKVDVWTMQPTTFRWDTSPLKVVDNLIIGLQKRKRGTLQTESDLDSTRLIAN